MKYATPTGLLSALGFLLTRDLRAWVLRVVDEPAWLARMDADRCPDFGDEDA